MDSIVYPLPHSQLLCPMIRTPNIEGRFSRKCFGEVVYEIIDNSCYLFDAREEDKQNSSAHPLNLLFWCNNKQDKENDFKCRACSKSTISTIYYYCNRCSGGYHKECVDSPAVFISPFHPKYPLQFVKIFETFEKEFLCHSCGIPPKRLAYYSSICDLILDPVCANKRKFSSINNPKKHEHTLHYFSRKASSLTCDVCGTDDNKVCFYICHQCDFVVHLTCVNLPHVIQTSRHSHRLFYTPSLSSGKLSCGVCRQVIDESYGEYYCSKGCSYAVHCKCAMQSEVCDGKELKDKPENEYNSIKTYDEISDGIIRYFSHSHHTMRFYQDIGESYYKKKQCEACLLPLYGGISIYRCMQCDFVLHEACAYLPSMKQNMVHAHPFILKPGNIKDYFKCRLCYRYSFGFKYICCEGCNISLDVRCASLFEPVNHQSHQHPLFLLHTRKYVEPCSICGKYFHILLNCVKCVFALCFRCATLPYKVKQEDDEHWLTLSYENDAIYPCWCQICEENMNPQKGYYTCSECSTTSHIECILGNDPYMIPRTQDLTFPYVGEKKVHIMSNDHLVRPICNYCKTRCPYKIAFKIDGKIVCSLSHTNYYIY